MPGNGNRDRLRHWRVERTQRTAREIRVIGVIFAGTFALGIALLSATDGYARRSGIFCLQPAPASPRGDFVGDGCAGLHRPDRDRAVVQELQLVHLTHCWHERCAHHRYRRSIICYCADCRHHRQWRLQVVGVALGMLAMLITPKRSVHAPPAADDVVGCGTGASSGAIGLYASFYLNIASRPGGCPRRHAVWSGVSLCAGARPDFAQDGIRMNGDRTLLAAQGIVRRQRVRRVIAALLATDAQAISPINTLRTTACRRFQVGRMTVFRTLDLLAEIGVIQPIYCGQRRSPFRRCSKTVITTIWCACTVRRQSNLTIVRWRMKWSGNSQHGTTSRLPPFARNLRLLSRLSAHQQMNAGRQDENSHQCLGYPSVNAIQ